MIETLIREAHASWSSEPEVLVWTPIRGSIDVVLRRATGPAVACEAQSELRRLEQQVRWARMKADALAARSSLNGIGPDAGAAVSTLLLLRATAVNVAVIVRYAETLRAAYPGGHAAAVASLRGTAPWPGSAIAWMDVSGGRAAFRASPPRGVPSW
jgi:hypothetical protein